MVAHPAHRRVAGAWRNPDFHRQFRPRVGAVSVSLSHARAAPHPRHFGLLP